ncbi:MAG: DUF368 domain-containing protein [Clostridia bacterium]|nr:DUF368 domain-containing protein [Clostridia bacterium]MDD4375584.1 DUF368 domain-containing protein [Clostridia bacterium]
MESLILFLKGIIVGIGGISPGLSGSVLLVILGLYHKVIDSLANLFKNFKKNILFFLPIGIGMLIGVVLFSRLINFTLEKFELQTRLAFLGLIIGTIPMFYKETKKEGKLKPLHYILLLIAFIIGSYIFTFNNTFFKPVTTLNFFKAFLLGFVGMSATIVPGIDGAATLSALGLYEQWLILTSLSSFSFNIYIPAAIGMLTSIFILSRIISFMIKKYYTATFAVLFGFFLSITPTILKTTNGGFISIKNNTGSYVGILLLIIGLIASYFFGKTKKEEKIN